MVYYYLKNDVENYIQYEKFITYLYRRCDFVTFSVPYFEWKKGEKQKEPIYKTNKMYLMQMQWLIDWLSDCVVSDGYEAEFTANYVRRITLKFNEKVYEFLLSRYALFDWVFPNTVEDLCFFSKGNCVVSTVSHEKFCEIFENNNEELNFLKKIVGLTLEERELNFMAPALDNQGRII